MPNYLLEIGTEELPADQVPEAQSRLKLLISEALEQAQLSFDNLTTYGTPRRIACIVNGLDAVQATTTKKVKGPPVKSSFDPQGKPLPPALGFAQKQGIEIGKLDQEEIAGVGYLVANLTIEGRPAKTVLAELVPKVIEQISGERLMRWGDSDFKFSRPIRWLVSLLDKEEVKFSVGGIPSGQTTFGHRILAPGAVTVQGPETYVEELRKAFVLADPNERKQVIERSVQTEAASVSGSPRQLSGSLLEEVVNITEWPCAVLGQFADEYLDLPDTLIETVMVHHQRYFPVESKADQQNLSNKLLPYFISVANNDRDNAKPQIKLGNERVLRARLADGRFFYFDDQKTKLVQRKEALSQLTFHEGLGSYVEKQERMTQAARKLADELKLEAKLAICLERTLELCKLDLVSNLVRELPELQGHVGSWYARLEGEPPEVVAAIASHYSPRSTEDDIPSDAIGKMAAIVDKLDNLVAIFATGKRPSGSSDPYILRRQAQGLVDILIDGLPNFRISITNLSQTLLGLLTAKLNANKRWSDGQSAQKGIADLRDFLLQRVKLKLLDRGFKREVVDAALLSRDALNDLPDLVTRLECLEKLLAADSGLDLIRVGVRVGNILTAESPSTVRAELFEDEAETELWDAFNGCLVKNWQQTDEFRIAKSAEEYAQLVVLLQKVSPLVDNLFDKVMVNDPNQSKRDNRHALLKNLDRYYRSIADFPKLQPLLT
jgi:glycyl-tRNA synthetase beta chain